MDRKEFDTLRKGLVDAATRELGAAPVPHSRPVASGLARRSLRWISGESVFDLEAEDQTFLILEIKPREGNVLGLLEEQKARAARTPTLTLSDLRSKVVRRDGFVEIPEIPMVNQGDRGYCAVAVLERIGRYYGLDVNQDLLADLARTDPRQGTTDDGIEKSVRRFCNGNGLTFNKIWDRTRELTGNYRRPPTLKDFEPSKGDQTKLMDRVRRNIDEGLPILWTVELAAAGEAGTLGESGHLRLIIGYNPSTSEIIYTDTWGPGHERKTMPLEKATRMTVALNVIRPIR